MAARLSTTSIPGIAANKGVREAMALGSARTGNAASDRAEILDDYADLSLSFEENRGQTDSRVDFLGRGAGYAVFLTPTVAVISMQSQSPKNSEFTIATSELRERFPPLVSHASELTAHSRGGISIHMQIVGANARAKPLGLQGLPGKVNYLLGNDSSKWRSNIPTYAKVGYEDVYPGIDLVYYGRDQQLEYDFIVSPGADPNAIALDFAGAEGIEINPQGDLVLHTAAGNLIQQKPYVYQEIDGTRQQIPGAFALSSAADHGLLATDSSTVKFAIGAFDKSHPLVIDPLFLRYSTYLGGAGDSDAGFKIAVDAEDNSYVTGQTLSTNFPATPGAFDETYNGDLDAFVVKLNAQGTALVYATFLGGTHDDSAAGIAIDADGNAYVSGDTFLNTFPTTPGAFDTTYNGGGYDGFVAKLSVDGATLAYSTYLGGSGSDSADVEITLDSARNAYVTGRSKSPDFPVTTGAFDTTYNGGDGYGDVFVTKLNAAGSGVVYSTFLGAGGDDLGTGLALDAAGNAYVTGYGNSIGFPTTPGAFDTTYNGGPWDAFVTKLNADGSALVYSTFLGGRFSDSAGGIELDNHGYAYVTGATLSRDFPKTPGAFDTRYNGHFDAFVTKVKPDGTGLVYSTFLGGSAWDSASSPAVDTSGNVYVTGITSSADFPTTPGAFDNTMSVSFDLFVAKLNSEGSALLYATFMGGSGQDEGLGITLDGAGHVYVTGNTGSNNFPTTPGAFKTENSGNYDAFVVKFMNR
jgi:hypothetical protein